MAEAHTTIYTLVKDGQADHEWEDRAGCHEGHRFAGRVRAIVVDGATEAYGAIQWANQLVNSFLDATDRPPHPDDFPPATLHPEAIDGWIGRMQKVWTDGAEDPSVGPFALFAERKAESGSFATLLGCEIDGLQQGTPRWTAVSLGDTVLFHVRDGELVDLFPRMEVTDFGLNPHGVSTLPGYRDVMRAHLDIRSQPLRVGDVLYLVTDACAEWMLRTAGPELWATLAALDHPDVFTSLVIDLRAAKAMKNDDVTLLRMKIVEGRLNSLKLAQ